MYILNVTYHTVAHVLVDNSTPCYIQIINPGSKVFIIRKKFRLGIIIKVYELGMITVIIPVVLTALAVAAAVELILIPALI